MPRVSNKPLTPFAEADKIQKDLAKLDAKHAASLLKYDVKRKEILAKASAAAKGLLERADEIAAKTAQK